MNLASQGFYTFNVDRRAKKHQIKNAIEEQYKVDILEVKIILMKGKSKKVGRTRREVKGKPWKKAIIKVKKGQKIEVFEKGK